MEIYYKHCLRNVSQDLNITYTAGEMFQRATQHFRNYRCGLQAHNKDDYTVKNWRIRKDSKEIKWMKLNKYKV